MSYNITQNVTPIEMLPELEDLERGNFNDNIYQSPIQKNINSTTSMYPGAAMLPPNEIDKLGRYIRGNHIMPRESGMLPYQEVIPSRQNYGTPINKESLLEQEKGLTTYNMPSNTPTCLEVAEHIANCPICSKLYNNDKTIYIIAIVVLAIISIFLLKRVLDV